MRNPLPARRVFRAAKPPSSSERCADPRVRPGPRSSSSPRQVGACPARVRVFGSADGPAPGPRCSAPLRHVRGAAEPLPAPVAGRNSYSCSVAAPVPVSPVMTERSPGPGVGAQPGARSGAAGAGAAGRNPPPSPRDGAGRELPGRGASGLPAGRALLPLCCGLYELRRKRAVRAALRSSSDPALRRHQR